MRIPATGAAESANEKTRTSDSIRIVRPTCRSSNIAEKCAISFVAASRFLRYHHWIRVPFISTATYAYHMDWTQWTPRELANLCFIVKDGRVLLIRKKRGLGAGKINGPGGKLEPDESALAAAIRETQEEIGVTPLAIEERGILRFQFTDGYSLLCTVFLAGDFEGIPIETDEATPIWFATSEIPFDEMWADDRHWLPEMLAGARFEGWFEFDGETMLSRDVRLLG
jgi:8-oxo-dGTP diphosphatase